MIRSHQGISSRTARVETTHLDHFEQPKEHTVHQLPYANKIETEAQGVRPLFQTPDWFLKGKRYNIRLRSEIVREFLGDGQFNSILDIGCGDGSLSLPLLTQSNRLTLLDISIGMLDAARANIPSGLAANVRIINDDFMQTQLEPRSYDLIICVGVLAYVKSPDATIAKIASLLKPGGSVITENTNSAHPLTMLYTRLARALKPNYPISRVRSKDVLAAYSHHGLRLSGLFRYSLAQPGIAHVLSQDRLYRLLRLIHGNTKKNRNIWLANEFLYHFKR